MRWPVLAVAAAAVLAPLPGTAHAAPPSIAGLTCGLLTTTDVVGVLANPGTQVGYVWGGPVAAGHLPSYDDGVLRWDVEGNPVSVLIGCDVQVTTPRFADVDYVSATATGTGAAVVVPTFVWYQLLPSNPVYLCTHVTVTDARGATATAYFDAVTRTFVSSPEDAECEVATSQQVPPKEACDVLPTGCPVESADVRVVTPTAITP
jgi:hypothetical protein